MWPIAHIRAINWSVLYLPKWPSTQHQPLQVQPRKQHIDALIDRTQHVARWGTR